MMRGAAVYNGHGGCSGHGGRVLTALTADAAEENSSSFSVHSVSSVVIFFLGFLREEFMKGFSSRSEKVLPFLLLLFALGGKDAAVISAKNQHGC